MDTAIMGRKTLDAGLRMTGGKLPKILSNNKLNNYVVACGLMA